MLLFKCREFIISVGFNPISRRESPKCLFWNDPTTGEWDTKPSNLAGYIEVDIELSPQFWRETDTGFILYQPGICFDLAYSGPPYVWTMKALQAAA